MMVHVTKDSGVRDYWTFSWLRFPAGYAFEERAIHPPSPQIKLDPKRRELLIAEKRGIPSPDIYHPLEDVPGISRIFSEVRTPSAALAFANEYGTLGFDRVPRFLLRHDSDGGERVMDWLHEAQRLRNLYTLLDLCASGDQRELSKMVHWGAGSVMVSFSKTIKRAIAHSGKNTQWLKRWKHGDPFGPSKLFIAEEYNSQIDQMASPLLLLDLKSDLRPHISPTCLLGAIWLEFGEVASGVRKQIPCEYCGRIMDVTGLNRNKRVHKNCSLRVRMARYRQGLKG
jgi:hypothetical protein